MARILRTDIYIFDIDQLEYNYNRLAAKTKFSSLLVRAKSEDFECSLSFSVYLLKNSSILLAYGTALR